MSNRINEIINNIADTLRESSEIESVTINSDSEDLSIPTANITLEDVEYFQPDDSAFATWGRLDLKIQISTSGITEFEGTLRAAEICEQIVEALEDDPTRDGNCSDLPIGAATEIAKACKSKNSQAYSQFTLFVKCHFEKEPTDDTLQQN